MTQLLKPIDYSEIKHLEVNVNELPKPGQERLNNTLYGSNCPQLNRVNPRYLSPDQKLAKGYRDALKGSMLSSLCDDLHYLKGWDIGHADLKASQERVEQAGLKAMWTCRTLNGALSDLAYHLKYIQGEETIEVWYCSTTYRYLLCATPSFIDRVLPF